MRELIINNKKATNEGFRFRGKEPGRLENFSDAVFALAVTLLLISTTPPTNFEQIKRFSFELIPFLLCIALIISIWHEHYVYFLRYGLRNGKIIVLNTLFLVIVLFYVYPLKFLTKLILYPIGYLVNEQSIMDDLAKMIRGEDMADLMIIYGLGASGVFFVLMLMYRYAHQQADELDLSELERFETKVKVRSSLLMSLIPLISVLVAFCFRGHWLAGMLGGFTYFLYTPVMIFHGRHVDRERKKLTEQNQNATD